MAKANSTKTVDQAAAAAMPPLALCLSGGGFRATLLHLGAAQRLNELGLLSQLHTITSVSGGSIFSGILALAWPKLLRDPASKVFTNFADLVERPTYDFCGHDFFAVLLRKRASPLNAVRLMKHSETFVNLLCEGYAEQLGMAVPLASLTESPRFLFCATNLETGACWRFGGGPRGTIGDPYVGYRPNDGFDLATAVAASSAFPLAFPPLYLQFRDPEAFTGGAKGYSGQLLSTSLCREVPLTDGGVYDNLGLEPVWSAESDSMREPLTLLVSNAGHPFVQEDQTNPALTSRLQRSYDIAANQVNALRTRWLIERFGRDPQRFPGTLWSIGSSVDHFETPAEKAARLAAGSIAPITKHSGYRDEALARLRAVRTHLDRFSQGEMGCLVNHGYALAAAAVSTWLPQLVPAGAPGFQWPYPDLADPKAAIEALFHSDRRDWMASLWHMALGER